MEYRGPERRRVPRDAVAKFVRPDTKEEEFVVPAVWESDFAAIRRVAAEAGVDPSSMVILRNLK